MSESTGSTQADPIFRLLEPLLDRLADKVVERLSRSPNGRPTTENDVWLTPEKASAILGVNKKWLYRHAKDLSFAKKLSRKALRFNEAGLRRWMATRR